MHDFSEQVATLTRDDVEANELWIHWHTGRGMFQEIGPEDFKTRRECERKLKVIAGCIVTIKHYGNVALTKDGSAVDQEVTDLIRNYEGVPHEQMTVEDFPVFEDIWAKIDEIYSQRSSSDGSVQSTVAADAATTKAAKPKRSKKAS